MLVPSLLNIQTKKKKKNYIKKRGEIKWLSEPKLKMAILENCRGIYFLSAPSWQPSAGSNSSPEVCASSSTSIPVDCSEGAEERRGGTQSHQLQLLPTCQQLQDWDSSQALESQSGKSSTSSNFSAFYTAGKNRICSNFLAQGQH